MTTPAIPTLLPHLWKSALVSGILAIVLGALVFWRPVAFVWVMAIFFGAYLLVTGIAQLVLAFSVKGTPGRALLFVSGAASLVLAVMCFINFQNSVDLLAIWIGVGFIFRGVSTVMSAVSDPSLPGRIWEIVVGVVSVLAGIVMFVRPFEGLLVITQVTGIILILIGIMEVVSAFAIRKAAKEGLPPITTPS